MPSFYDRVKVLTATTGTGTLLLSVASSGCRTFSGAGVTNGTTVRYLIEEGVGWEIGSGVYSSSAGTLTRSLESSSTGSLLVLMGDATVAVIAAAADLAGFGSPAGAALTKTDDTNVTITLGGAPTTALLAAASITVGWTGTLSAARGGTGISAFGTGVATALGVNIGSAGAFVTFNGALGTPSSGTLTNATGLPVAGITASTSTALGVGSLELGHATDTTITRVSAGVAAIEGANILVSGGALGTPASGTLTNATGLPIAGLTASTSTALGVGSVELGHATDTTVARASAGDISVEGNRIFRVGGSASGMPFQLEVAASDETTALTTGTAKVTFRMPRAVTLTAVRASLSTAQTSGSIFTVDVNEAGTTIISTKLTIDNAEKTSTTAATAAVISDSSLADDAEMTIDIDQIGDGTAKGLKVTLIGTIT